jgi:hypothetical protein
VIYKLLVCTLLAIVPVTGLRMICVDPPVASRAEVGPAASGGQDCEETCARKPVKRSSTPTCMLLADGCTVILIAVVAVVPAHMPVLQRAQAAPFEPALYQFYLSPTLDLHAPPPKA